MSEAKRELIESLKLSCRNLLHDNDYAAVRQYFTSMNVDINSAFILNWIPEENSDIYEILVNKADIYVLEISKEDSGDVLENERLKLNIYSNSKLSKETRQRLECALEIE
jgi:S-adenosylmethionine:diacylglycerol 3-amino-3-carboxypropyl transferase